MTLAWSRKHLYGLDADLLPLFRASAQCKLPEDKGEDTHGLYACVETGLYGGISHLT